MIKTTRIANETRNDVFDTKQPDFRMRPVVQDECLFFWWPRPCNSPVIKVSSRSTAIVNIRLSAFINRDCRILTKLVCPRYINITIIILFRVQYIWFNWFSPVLRSKSESVPLSCRHVRPYIMLKRSGHIVKAVRIISELTFVGHLPTNKCCRFLQYIRFS